MALSDILSSIPGGDDARPVELGKIKLGGKSKQVRTTQGGKEWRAPEKYDHFVITTMSRDATGDLAVDETLMAQLIRDHGDNDGKLRAIPIRLLSDDLDDVIQSSFVWYGGRQINAKSDGKTTTWYVDENGKRTDKPFVEPWRAELFDWKDDKGNRYFKVHSNFNCVIAATDARWGGVYKLRTTSVISLRQLYGSLLHLSQLTGGILVGMPLMLVMRPMQVSPNGKPTTIYVVHVELRGGDMQSLQSQAMEMAKFRLAFKTQIESTTRQYKKLLALPGDEPADEVQVIGEEFAPENFVDESTTQERPEAEQSSAAELTKQFMRKPVAADPPPVVSEPPEATTTEPTQEVVDADTGEVLPQEEPTASKPPESEPPKPPTIETFDQLASAMREHEIAAQIAEGEMDEWWKGYLLGKGLKGKARSMTPQQLNVAYAAFLMKFPPKG